MDTRSFLLKVIVQIEKLESLILTQNEKTRAALEKVSAIELLLIEKGVLTNDEIREKMRVVKRKLGKE